MSHGLDKMSAQPTWPVLFKVDLSGLQVSPQQDDLRLSGPPSGQGAGGRTRTREKRVPADLRAHSLANMPPTLLLQLRM
ncbi:hypothetical protein PoB_003310400 [Plakobranchus ocellatus]|uniref:Uncharacterized protein n=1 Tax=Plakobranchus ocellatus TaxID=259542 RepID=A0AAV4AK43_9GAST|nr:hypothetical protein PoB_003310400 [Plakobranchus ocellatus]